MLLFDGLLDAHFVVTLRAREYSANFHKFKPFAGGAGCMLNDGHKCIVALELLETALHGAGQILHRLQTA